MDVPNQLQQIGVLVADDGFVTILEKMAGALVAQVEDHGVAGQQSPHDLGEGALIRPQQQMEVVVEQRPGKTVGSRFGQQKAKAGEEASRSWSSRKMGRLSIPLTITCWSRPGMSMRACLGMSGK